MAPDPLSLPAIHASHVGIWIADASGRVQRVGRGEAIAAVIERGTTHAQRIAKADLATLADEVLRLGIRPPSLTIVGDVVSLYPRLSWFQPEEPPAASPLPHAGCAVVHAPRKA